nr:hypothetical protein [Tanacetum cinerariifolium]
MVFRFIPCEVQCEAVLQDLLDRDEALKQLKYHFQHAQACMKASADRHHRDVKFSVGDWVFLKLCPHRQQSVVKRINQKLSARFYCLFPIIARVGSIAYKLQLPESAKVHPNFHVSLFKRAVGNAPLEASLPPDEATWEDALEIQTQFPNFRLEDKPFFQDTSIDKEQPTTFIIQPKKDQHRPNEWEARCNFPSRRKFILFFMSLLKRAIGNAPLEASLPPGFETDASPDVEPVKCLATRTI